MKTILRLSKIIIAVTVVITGLLGCSKKSQHTGKPDLYIASILPATGAAAEIGVQHRDACELFVSHYNQKPDAKFHLRYTFQDSQSTPKGGVNAAQALLVENPPPRFFLVHQGAITMAVTPVLTQASALMLYVGATDQPKKIMSLAFRNYPDPVLIARTTVKFFVPNPAATRLAVIVSSDDFGITMENAIRDVLKQMQAQPVADEKFDSTASDFRSLITRVLGQSPSAIYLIGVGNPLGRLVTQIRQLGFQGDIIGGPEM